MLGDGKAAAVIVGPCVPLSKIQRVPRGNFAPKKCPREENHTWWLGYRYHATT